VSAQTASQHYVVPPGKGLGRSLTLALAMHGLLLLMLILGLSWRSTTPAVVEAELWSALPQEAAALPEPQPIVPVEPVKPLVELEPRPVPTLKADITVKEETPKKVHEVHPIPVPPKQVVAPKPTPKPMVTPTPANPSALAYLQQQAKSEAKGSDAHTSGPRGTDTYVARLVAKIRSNTIFPTAGVAGNPTVKILIEQLPSGEVTGVTIVASSGLRAFDEAVQRGVQASSPLPKDVQGRVERSITVDYSMFQDAPN
jgi:colicin import membrane protein